MKILWISLIILDLLFLVFISSRIKEASMMFENIYILLSFQHLTIMLLGGLFATNLDRVEKKRMLMILAFVIASSFILVLTYPYYFIWIPSAEFHQLLLLVFSYFVSYAIINFKEMEKEMI
ncbi:MAG: hypothetical protein RR543_02705 [Erysipelotrichales bacterium]